MFRSLAGGGEGRLELGYLTLAGPGFRVQCPHHAS